jgi:hypothetical protein
MLRICRATFRCSAFTNLQKVDWTGSLLTLRMARQDRVACDEAQLIQPCKADVEAEHNPQHESVQIHGAGNPLRGHRLFHQRLESEFLQHGDDRQQSAVGSQILAGEVIGRGSTDFIGLRNNITNPLIGGPSAAILFLFVNHLGWLLRIGSRSCELRGPTVLTQDSQGSQMAPRLSPPSGRQALCIAQVKLLLSAYNPKVKDDGLHSRMIQSSPLLCAWLPTRMLASR